MDDDAVVYPYHKLRIAKGTEYYTDNPSKAGPRTAMRTYSTIAKTDSTADLSYVHWQSGKYMRAKTGLGRQRRTRGGIYSMVFVKMDNNTRISGGRRDFGGIKARYPPLVKKSRQIPTLARFLSGWFMSGFLAEFLRSENYEKGI